MLIHQHQQGGPAFDAPGQLPFSSAAQGADCIISEPFAAEGSAITGAADANGGMVLAASDDALLDEAAAAAARTRIHLSPLLVAHAVPAGPPTGLVPTASVRRASNAGHGNGARQTTSVPGHAASTGATATTTVAAAAGAFPLEAMVQNSTSDPGATSSSQPPHISLSGLELLSSLSNLPASGATGVGPDGAPRSPVYVTDELMVRATRGVAARVRCCEWLPGM
jgi:hypothetical protein